MLKTVKAHAFTVSPLPVIISIENHCSVKQQDTMALMIEETLGDMLALPDTSRAIFPSPLALRGKILLKATTGGSSGPGGDDDDDDDGGDMDLFSKANAGGGGSSSSSSSSKVSARFSALVYLRTVKSRSRGKYWEMRSFSENKLENLYKSDAGSVAEYTKHQLVRVYPRGDRFDSSNYNPVPAWLCGCQLVALNVQTEGRSMSKNRGMFGGAAAGGYRLKPPYLLDPAAHGFDPTRKEKALRRAIAAGTVPPRRVLVLHVQVVSGMCIPNVTANDIVDPYVKLTLFGATCDQASHKTKTVSNNGFNPVWLNEKFQFEVFYPEVALLRFSIRDSNFTEDVSIGGLTVPVLELQPGIRCMRPQRQADVDVSRTIILLKISVGWKDSSA